jgi:allantoinase
VTGRPEDAAGLVVRARRAVLGAGQEERSCTVQVRRGVVAAVGAYDTPVDEALVVDLGADVVLLPGLVDTHVHVNEPGRTEWEGFASATRAAAAGGVTTLLDMPLNSIPPTLDPNSLEVKRAAARGACFVDVGFWGGAVPSNLGALRPLLEAGVFGVKCFLPDSGVPEFPSLGAAGLVAACEELAGFDGLLLVHAEDPDVLAAAPPPGGPSYERFLASRPHAAEDSAIAAVVDAARRTAARVHVVHLSSAAALPLLAAARADGVRITVETCPHYLTLASEQIAAGATQFKCCPPIRDVANRDALWAGLAAGTIDMVVSDHSPCTGDLKCLDTGDFATAWGGIASLQLGLSLVWSEARRRDCRLGDVVGWMSSQPAHIAGVVGKGAIAVGCAADLVAFAPDDEFVVDPRALHHRNPETPYAGERLTGVVRRTWLGGREVDEEPRGRLLTRGAAL